MCGIKPVLLSEWYKSMYLCRRNDIIHCRLDYNEHLRRGQKGFLNTCPKTVMQMEDKWNRYIAKNLTDDESDEGAEDGDNEMPVSMPRTKSNIHQEDIVFKFNLWGEPIIPPTSLGDKLDDKKHTLRCFLKAHYGRKISF